MPDQLEVVVGRQQRSGVASGADGGVDEDAGRHRSQEFDDAVDHDRAVLEAVHRPASGAACAAGYSGSLIGNPPVRGRTSGCLSRSS